MTRARAEIRMLTTVALLCATILVGAWCVLTPARTTTAADARVAPPTWPGLSCDITGVCCRMPRLQAICPPGSAYP